MKFVDFVNKLSVKRNFEEFIHALPELTVQCDQKVTVHL